MVNQKNLFAASLITTLVGIFILLTIVETFELQTQTIRSVLNNPTVDQKVKVEGRITRLTNTETTKIINIKDKTAEIPIIAFTEDSLNLKKGNYITVEGKVMIYQNQTEINADLIEKKL